MTEQETRELTQMTERFLKSYAHKDKQISDELWLKGELKRELPDRTEEELSDMARDIVNSVKEFDSNLSDLNHACDSGLSKESWFASKVSEASVGMSIVEYGDYLNSIDIAMTHANAQMMDTVMTQAGEISQNQNLHGFIAEQYLSLINI